MIDTSLNTGMMTPMDASSSSIDGQVDSLRMMSLRNKGDKMSPKQMREVSNQFETMVLRQLLKEMRKTVPNDGFLERSNATEMYTDIADDYLSTQMAEKGAMGISDMIYNELKEKNDKLANKGDLEKKKDFVDLKSRDSNGEPKFIPIKSLTADRFIDMHNKEAKMIPLPSKETQYMPLGSRRNITTDKISQK